MRTGVVKTLNNTPKKKFIKKETRRVLSFVRRFVSFAYQRNRAQNVNKSCTWKRQMSSLEDVLIFHFILLRWQGREKRSKLELIDSVFFFAGVRSGHELKIWNSCCKSCYQLPVCSLQQLHYRLMRCILSPCLAEMKADEHVCDERLMRCACRFTDSDTMTLGRSLVSTFPSQMPLFIAMNSGSVIERLLNISYIAEAKSSVQ